MVLVYEWYVVESSMPMLAVIHLYTQFYSLSSKKRSAAKWSINSPQDRLDSNRSSQFPPIGANKATQLANTHKHHSGAVSKLVDLVTN